MTIQKYNIEKTQNLAKLVQEFETECALKKSKIYRERKNNCMALELDGLVKLQDAVLEEDDIINQMNIKMLNHFRALHAKMTADYSVYDAMFHTYKNSKQKIKNNPNSHLIKTKNQLRRFMNEFNGQHRK